MEARSSRFLDPGAVPLKRKPDGNFWAKLVHLTWWLLVIASVALLVAVYFPPFRNAQRYETQIESYQRLIASDKDRYELLSQNLELLKNDPDYIQRIARDKLNLGKPGEMIFRFDPYPPTTDTQIPYQ